MERLIKTIHRPPDNAERLYQWYHRAQVDYTVHYLQLYIAYNTWYREVTHAMNDREALSSLKKRFVIWDDYTKGEALSQLLPYMKRLTELSQQKPFVSTRVYWNGEFNNQYDWRSLIEFWYQTRCLIVHGSDCEQRTAWLAYETLSIFMGEIITRMQACFGDDDLAKMEELTSIAEKEPHRSQKFKKLQHQLYQKYIASPDIWQVDMNRANPGYKYGK